MTIGGGSSRINDFTEEVYFKGGQVPKFVGLVFGTTVALLVNRPEPCEELFQSKNKYFEKHPRSARFARRLFGDSILFAKSDITWQRKRKSLSTALYKEKLKIMLDMIKRVTIDEITGVWMKAENHEIDIVEAASQIFIKITLQGLFGAGNSEVKVLQKIDGVESM